MTDMEAIGRAVQEKKTIEAELKTLRIKADRYAEYWSGLGQALRHNPAGVVFDDQISAVGTMEVHLNSKDFDIAGVVETVVQIRAKESRLKDLNSLLG